MLKICIGYDPRETVAYHVLCHSILRQASKPVSFIPINKRNIPEFTRGIEDGSTEFSFSRFLVPWLCDQEGVAIFMDCDMLVRCDIYELLNYLQHYDVAVVKHNYTPKPDDKFLGNKQHIYPRKNWSSLMVFDCGGIYSSDLCLDKVNYMPGSYLHQFKWCEDQYIGEIPKEYNHLVGEYEPNPDAKIVHFTLGTPCFKGYENQEFADEWFKERELMLHAD